MLTRLIAAPDPNWPRGANQMRQQSNSQERFRRSNALSHLDCRGAQPQPLVSDVQVAKDAIGRIVQEAQGGRKASLDHFSYADEERAAQLIHHIAVYLE